MLASSASVNRFKLVYAKKIYPRLLHSSLCATIDTSWEQPQETSRSWEKEDVRFFFGHSRVFVFIGSWKGCAERWKEGEREGERKGEKEWEMPSERVETEMRWKLFTDVWETDPRYANLRLVERRSAKRVGGYFRCQKKAATFILALCAYPSSGPVVPILNMTILNRHSVIKNSPRPFLIMFALRSTKMLTNLWEVRDASDNTVWSIYNL